MAHKKYHYPPVGIYAITCPGGEMYIGQSRNILSRRCKHFNLRFNRHPKLKECLIKYGIENCKFEVLYPFPADVSAKEMDSYEAFYIMQYKAAGVELLNMTNGGIGSHGRVLSEETINKIRVANTGKPGTFLGRNHSEESKIKIGIKSRQRVTTEATRKKLSASLKGRKVSEKTIEALIERNKNRVYTEDMRNNISESAKNRVVLFHTQTGIFYNYDEAVALTGYTRKSLMNVLGNFRTNKTGLARV